MVKRAAERSAAFLFWTLTISYNYSISSVVTNKLKCLRCGYEWICRIENPKCCPSCTSRKWNVPRRPLLAVGRTASGEPSLSREQIQAAVKVAIQSEVPETHIELDEGA